MNRMAIIHREETHAKRERRRRHMAYANTPRSLLTRAGDSFRYQKDRPVRQTGLRGCSPSHTDPLFPPIYFRGV